MEAVQNFGAGKYVKHHWAWQRVVLDTLVTYLPVISGGLIGTANDHTSQLGIFQADNSMDFEKHLLRVDGKDDREGRGRSFFVNDQVELAVVPIPRW